jgi:hypothetical protein
LRLNGKSISGATRFVLAPGCSIGGPLGLALTLGRMIAHSKSFNLERSIHESALNHRLIAARPSAWFIAGL